MHAAATAALARITVGGRLERSASQCLAAVLESMSSKRARAGSTVAEAAAGVVSSSGAAVVEEQKSPLVQQVQGSTATSSEQ
jgi:hypothetical protein